MARFFNDDYNITAINQMYRKFSGYIDKWQTVQVIRLDVPNEKIVFSNNKKKLQTLNQSYDLSMHGRCALVGNAGILLESGCGDVIDKNDLVIRMNLAPSGGEFKRDVGSRIDLVTLNLEQIGRLVSCTNSHFPANWTCSEADKVCLENREKKYPFKRKPTQCDDLIERVKRINGSTMWFFKSLVKDTSDLRRMLGTLQRQYNLTIKFAYSPVSLMQPAGRALDLGFPSSGMAIYSAATQFCRQITMFGFYPFNQDEKNRTLQHHYYEKKTMNYTANKHGMPNEYRILIKLNQTGAIHLVNDCK